MTARRGRSLGQMHVVLVHGLGRTPASLAILGARLRTAGFRTSSFGYVAFAERIESIAARLSSHISSRSANTPYALVTHSLGGVIARAASPALPAGLTRLVMLAPPNSVPAMARALGDSRFFRAFAGHAGRCLQDEAFYARLPIPDVPTLVIAGTSGPKTRVLPFGAGAHDGVVAVG